MRNITTIILFSLFLISCQSNSLDYTILDKTDISLSENPGMKYRIILNVDSLPTDEEMSITATNIWKQGNKSWNEFDVLMYLPGMNTEWAPYTSFEFDQTGLINVRKRIAMITGTQWETNPSKSKKYTIDISTSEVVNKNVSISIVTNFPDNTNLLITVGREYYMEGIEEVYSGDIFNENVTVKNGIIKTMANISDKEWYDEAQKLSNISPDDQWTQISKVSDTIDIEVLFSPRRKQSKEILEILGKDGESIIGNEVDKSLGFTTFRVSKKINLPFKR